MDKALDCAAGLCGFIHQNEHPGVEGDGRSPGTVGWDLCVNTGKTALS